MVVVVSNSQKTALGHANHFGVADGDSKMVGVSSCDRIALQRFKEDLVQLCNPRLTSGEQAKVKIPDGRTLVVLAGGGMDDELRRGEESEDEMIMSSSDAGAEKVDSPPALTKGGVGDHESCTGPLLPLVQKEPPAIRPPKTSPRVKTTRPKTSPLRPLAHKVDLYLLLFQPWTKRVTGLIDAADQCLSRSKWIALGSSASILSSGILMPDFKNESSWMFAHGLLKLLGAALPWFTMTLLLFSDAVAMSAKDQIKKFKMFAEQRAVCFQQRKERCVARGKVVREVEKSCIASQGERVGGEGAGGEEDGIELKELTDLVLTGCPEERLGDADPMKAPALLNESMAHFYRLVTQLAHMRRSLNFAIALFLWTMPIKFLLAAIPEFNLGHTGPG